MRIFVSTDHDGHFPVGVASVVIAADEAAARVLLDAELSGQGLDPTKPYTLLELVGMAPRALILSNGDY